MNDSIILKNEFIPDDMVVNYFCSCDIVAQPYKSATQSGVTQIAYHFEKPMLVTDVGGLAEIVKHGVSGYVCSPDVDSVYQSLNNFLRTTGMMNLFLELSKKRKDFPGISSSAISKNYTRTCNEEDFILIYLQYEFFNCFIGIFNC